MLEVTLNCDLHNVRSQMFAQQEVHIVLVIFDADCNELNYCVEMAMIAKLLAIMILNKQILCKGPQPNGEA